MHREILQRVCEGRHLSIDQMRLVVDEVMRGSWQDEQLAALLTALRDNGETAEEIAGAALALRDHMTPIRSKRTDLLDTCGTGGDASGTFNISTAAALVTAAAGVPVAKHGNRRITSKSGSADVLAALGVRVDAEREVVERCLDELGICFCFAPALHPAMKRVAEVRRSLGFPTIFNLLGPLSNPAFAPCQLLGVGRAELRPRLARALQLLAPRRAAVVCGDDGLDEVTLSGSTQVSVVTSEGVEEASWMPEDFGIAAGADDSLLAETPEQSAAVIRRVLDGAPGAARNIVLLNAAAALWVAEAESDLAAGAARAAAAIDDGRAKQLLQQLAEASRS